MVHAIVAETPVAFVADIAPPVTFISPNVTFSTKGAALKTISRVVSRQRLAAIRTTGRCGRWYISACCEHVRRQKRAISLALEFPFLPSPVSEPEPVHAALSCAVAVKADIPLAVGADVTVIVQFIFYVLLLAS